MSLVARPCQPHAVPRSSPASAVAQQLRCQPVAAAPRRQQANDERTLSAARRQVRARVLCVEPQREPAAAAAGVCMWGGGYGGFDERPRHSKGTQAQHGVGFFACCSVAGSRMLTPGMLARPAPFPPAGDPGEQAALTPPHLGAREGRRADACSNAISSRAQRRHAIARFLPSAVHVRRGVRWLC